LRIFEPTREERQESGENCILRMMVKWAVHVECMGEVICMQNASQKTEGKRPLDDLIIDGRIILKT
jgi:hypothetical protein